MKLMRRIRTRRPAVHPRGQSLVEFAMVVPVLLLIVLGIMQFGILFWTQITLTQVARDTGRWAATQAGCSTAYVDVEGEAEAIAANSSLFGYSAGVLTVTPTWGPEPTDPESCPPDKNSQLKWVNITVSHTVPVFLPLAADNDCTGGCMRTLSTDVQYRMEPQI